MFLSHSYYNLFLFYPIISFFYSCLSFIKTTEIQKTWANLTLDGKEFTGLDFSDEAWDGSIGADPELCIVLHFVDDREANVDVLQHTLAPDQEDGGESGYSGVFHVLVLS